MIDEWVNYFCLSTKSDTLLLIHNQLKLIRLLELDSVQDFDIVSIINSIKICVDYCPVHEFCRFYCASVHWLCGDQTWIFLSRYSWSMISSDWYGIYLHIVILTRWYQSAVMIIIGQWSLQPLFLFIPMNCLKLSERSLWIQLCMKSWQFSILAMDWTIC